MTNVTNFSQKQDGKRGKEGVITNRYGVSFQGDENVMEIGNDDGCITWQIYGKPMNDMFQDGELYVCELYLNVLTKHTHKGGVVSFSFIGGLTEDCSLGDSLSDSSKELL